MTEHRDHRAEFGYSPSWDLQRKKQDEAAANFYENRDEHEAKLKQKYRNQP